MFEKIKQLSGKFGAASLMVFSIFFGFIGSANAALDTAVTDAFTSLTTTLGDYKAPAYGLLAAVLTFFIGLKWFRRVANKGT